jgi:pSer/pThr/pTyr-binding forkhead associated (FHA) protein
MLDNEKKELLKSMIPKAVLKAVTNESKHAIIRRVFGKDIIPIYNYPFRIGREARVEYVKGEVILQERHKLGGHEPNNDAYLLDNGKYLQISREHCSIEYDTSTDTYTLKDRNSACGSIINNSEVNNAHILKDGDIITLGSMESKYQLKFIILDAEYK